MLDTHCHVTLQCRNKPFFSAEQRSMRPRPLGYNLCNSLTLFWVPALSTLTSLIIWRWRCFPHFPQLPPPLPPLPSISPLLEVTVTVPLQVDPIRSLVFSGGWGGGGGRGRRGNREGKQIIKDTVVVHPDVSWAVSLPLRSRDRHIGHPCPPTCTSASKEKKQQQQHMHGNGMSVCVRQIASTNYSSERHRFFCVCVFCSSLACACTLGPACQRWEGFHTVGDWTAVWCRNPHWPAVR